MSKPALIDAGRFNRQLSLENEVDVPDGMGGFSRSFQPVGTVWANICPKSAKQQVEGANLVANVTHEITIRFQAQVRTGSRFITGTRRFDVVAMRDLDETRRYLVCDCQERR